MARHSGGGYLELTHAAQHETHARKPLVEVRKDGLLAILEPELHSVRGMTWG